MYKINLKGLALQDTYLKNRLDVINSTATGDGSILKFKNTKYETVPTTPFYLVGYPSVEAANPNSTRLAKRKAFMEPNGIFPNYPNKMNHYIIDKEELNKPIVQIKSVADCYRFQNGAFNLMGGSSGSMILNNSKEVVGIY
jgi:hypothetical protein